MFNAENAQSISAEISGLYSAMENQDSYYCYYQIIKLQLDMVADAFELQ